MTPTAFERLHGRDEPPRELRWLRAGPLDVALDGADLRYVRLGERELVRRVYVAVRDLVWDTIPEIERETSIEERDGGFVVRSRVRHRRGDIDFTWTGRIEGGADGAITYAMDGRCGSEFEFARLGLCVHHPTPECAGRPYRAQTPAGVVTGSLPRTIGPQVFDYDKGFELPLFPPFSALSLELEDDIQIGFEFRGELCETEDQRNWTDASLKTVAMPSYLGFRHRAKPGQGISQRVTIRHRAPASHRITRRTVGDRTVLAVGRPLGLTLPAIGFGLPSDGQPHTAREVERVRALSPAHLRADVEAGDDAALSRALDACSTVGAQLELALHVDRDDLAWVEAISRQVERASVARILVFERGRRTTAPAMVRAIRERVPSDLPIVGGTDFNFCDLNRDRPNEAGHDPITYSINSQVHAFDELSLVEALAGHADTAESARAIYPETPLVVSPVTMRPRFNPDADPTGEQVAADREQLPEPVDPRQMSRFCAVWTLGSVKALSETGVSALTYFETVGWRGLFERDAGNPRPELFPSTPGMLFPVYGLFSTLAEWAGAELIDVRTTHPLLAVGLGLRKNAQTCLLVGNLTPRPTRITVEVAQTPTTLRVEPYGLVVKAVS